MESKYLRLWNPTKDSIGKDWSTSSMWSTKRKESNGIGYNWISKGKASRSMDRSSRRLTPVASSDTTNTKIWKTKFQKLMEKWLAKKLVATTVSSREVGLERRIETVTTSSREQKTTKNNKTRTEFTSPWKVRIARKSSLLGSKRIRQTKALTKRQPVTKTKRIKTVTKRKQSKMKVVVTWKVKGGSSSSKNSPQTQKEEMTEKTTFIVLQKNTRSMNSSERSQEVFNEVHQMAWDVILISETWRQGKEIWETQQGHIMVESGWNQGNSPTNMESRYCWTEDGKIRSTGYNAHANVWLRWRSQSTSNRSSWWVCTCLTVAIRTIKSRKHTKRSPRRLRKTRAWISSAETSTLSLAQVKWSSCQLSVTDTLNKANCRGERMTQWLLEYSLVALNTMYRKIPQKQVTYHTPKNGEKQLDYTLTDRKNYSWSKDAEANDTIHMVSDHRCVMA